MTLGNITITSDKRLTIDKANNKTGSAPVNSNKGLTFTGLVSSMEQITSTIEEGKRSIKGGIMGGKSKNSIRGLKRHLKNFSDSRGPTGITTDSTQKKCTDITTEPTKSM